MTHYAGLDVSQKETTICVVDEQGRRLWRGTAPTDPEALTEILRQHGCDLRIGVETGPLMPWLVHGLRRNGLEVICLDARHAKAALAMQFNKNDRDDAEGLLRSCARAVSSDARICPVPASTPMCSLRQDRRLWVPCFSISHSPGPHSRRSVLSTSR